MDSLMKANPRPSLGSAQPESGSAMELAFYAMSSTRDSKKNRPIPVIRGVVGRNVEILRDRVYKEEPTVTGRNNKLAKAIGTKLAQIQRIIAGKIGTSIDTIEWLAEALGV